MVPATIIKRSYETTKRAMCTLLISIQSSQGFSTRITSGRPWPEGSGIGSRCGCRWYSRFLVFTLHYQLDCLNWDFNYVGVPTQACYSGIGFMFVRILGEKRLKVLNFSRGPEDVITTPFIRYEGFMLCNSIFYIREAVITRNGCNEWSKLRNELWAWSPA